MDTPMTDAAQLGAYHPQHSSQQQQQQQQQYGQPSQNVPGQSQSLQQSPSRVASATQQQQQPRRRIRVSRACDECRLRKTRCDGKQPCSSCQTFERHCSFNLKEGRKPAQRTRILEDRLRRAHAHILELQSKLPNQQHVNADELFQVPADTLSHEGDSGGDEEEALQSHASGNNRRDRSPDLANMMNRPGQMTSADWYAGSSSGFSFLLKTRELLKEQNSAGSTKSGRSGKDSNMKSQNLETDGKDMESLESRYREDPSHKALVELYDAPLPTRQVLDLEVPLGQLLPNLETSKELLHLVYDYVYPLLQFMDRKDMEYRLKRIYEVEPISFTDDDHDFIPLHYSLLALGNLFSRERHAEYGCEKSVAQAIRYYIAAEKMLDITRIRNITGLQTLICFSLFLMSTARLATCHTFVGLSMATALKLGLHVTHAANANFTQVQRDLRRRVFWTIAKLNSYTSSILGLPMLLDMDASEVTSNEVIAEVWGRSIDALHRQSDDEAYQMAASAAHFKLLIISAKATSTVFARTEPATISRFPRLTVRSSKILETEEQIRQWCEDSKQLLEHPDDSECFVVTNFDLRMTLAFTRIMLYKPFLHYLARRQDGDDAGSPSQMRLAYACITAAQQAIHHSSSTLNGSLLGQASWPAIYTVFMSITCLIFFLATRPVDAQRDEVQRDVEAGIHILSSTICQGTGASRCLDVIADLINCLKDTVKIDVEKIRHQARAYCDEPPKKGNDKSGRTAAMHSDDEHHTPKSDQQHEAPSQPQRSSHHQQHSQEITQRIADADYLASTALFPVAPYPSLSQQGYAGNMMFEPYPGVSNEHAQFEAVHIPFDSSFSWPYDSTVNNVDMQSSNLAPQQQQTAQGIDSGGSMQFSLSPQDIATYIGAQRRNRAAYPQSQNQGPPNGMR